MRILLADINHDILRQKLEAAGHTCDARWHLPAEEIQELLPEYEGLVIRSKFKLSADVLEHCRKMRVIGRVGAGMENIDLQHASKLGITCLCVPEGNRDAVGEHALGMLLMLLNHLKKADAEVRQGIWLRAENRGTEIKNKTVGIIGYGHMGSAFAEKLAGLGCNILAHDKYKTGFGNNKVKACSLHEIQQQADIVSLHLPLTEETKYYADDAFFRSFAKPIFFLNTARGKCLRTADLVQSMKENRVLGACLDVLEYESVSFEKLDTSGIPEPMKYLLASDRVILSPHIAGWTHESNYKMSEMIAEKMIAVLMD